MKLVIAIPFFSADRADAVRLARFIADLEPKARDDVELCLVNRYDAEPFTGAEVHNLITTFKVTTFQTTTKWDGWPAGCNAMALDFWNEAARRVRDGQWTDVDAALFCEPDCVPVARDWIDKLKAEWLASGKDGKWVVGCYRLGGGGHVNGNALFPPALAARIDLRVVDKGLAWDCSIAPQIQPHWRWTSLISNLWKEENVTDERFARNPWTGDKLPPVLIHGVKDGSARAYAEKMTNCKFR